jgi:hypothetical protein
MGGWSGANPEAGGQRAFANMLNLQKKIHFPSVVS